MGAPVPTHRIDAPAGYVLQLDTAWDWDAIAKITDEPSPLGLYYAGLTRYDLSQVRQYMRGDDQPTIFWLRQLPLEDYARALDMADGGTAAAGLWAFARGVTGVDGLRGMSDYDLAKRPHMTPHELQRFRDALSRPEWMIEVGQAVIRFSAGLTAAEGKP